MSADRWRKATPAEALEVLLARHRENFSPAEVREVEQAILALREADQRGAALAGGESRPAAVVPVDQAAPHHPGGQPVAWTTALALEFASGTPLALSVSPVNLWGENGIPLYTHPGGQEKADGKVEGDGKPAPASPGPEMVPRNRLLKLTLRAMLAAPHPDMVPREPKRGLLCGDVAISTDPRYAGWVFVRHVDGENWTTGAKLTPETWAMLVSAEEARNAT